MSPPDCETKASSPGSAAVWAKLAFRPSSGTSSPTQLGPRMRSRCGRAASSMACVRLRPSPSVRCRKPGGEHDGRAGAARAERADDARHGSRRRADDREVGRLGQARARRGTRAARRPPDAAVDRIDRPGKPARRAGCASRSRRRFPRGRTRRSRRSTSGGTGTRDCGSSRAVYALDAPSSLMQKLWK